MPTTTNFGWTTPADTDLVKDGASAMRTLGNGIDTSMAQLKGGTTGQILSKTSNTDMAFTWINNDQGDITAVTAGTGLSGGGTTGSVTLSLSSPVVETLGGTNQTTYATGDILYASGSNTLAKRSIGTSGQVLTVSGGVPTWANAAGGGKVLQVVYASYSTSTSNSTDSYADTGLSASITPSSTSSKILCIVNQTVASGVYNTGSVAVKLVRGSTDVLVFGDPYGFNFVSPSYGNCATASQTYLDSPSTTSSTTYKIQFKRIGGGTVTANGGNITTTQSTMTLLEIGA